MEGNGGQRENETRNNEHYYVVSVLDLLTLSTGQPWRCQAADAVQAAVTQARGPAPGRPREGLPRTAHRPPHPTSTTRFHTRLSCGQHNSACISITAMLKYRTVNLSPSTRRKVICHLQFYDKSRE